MLPPSRLGHRQSVGNGTLIGLAAHRLLKLGFGPADELRIAGRAHRRQRQHLIPSYIFGEAFLSYVGLGVQAPQTSWGALCSQAQVSLVFHPHLMFLPAGAIAMTMLAFTLLGDGLRDALDPRLRK